MWDQLFKIHDVDCVHDGTLALTEMKFTKFFDVKSPVSENVFGNYNNAGTDLFMPRISKKFLITLLEQNQTIYSNNLLLKINDINIESKEILLEDTIMSDEELSGWNFQLFYKSSEAVTQHQDNLIKLIDFDGVTQTFQFFERIQIPLGIAIEIPVGCYVDLRSKSSNFKNGYFEITGLIDSCYTYGMGVQLIPFQSNLITINPKIKVDEKITQIVLNQCVTIYNFVELSQDIWNKKSEVINRREKRIGGFGSTGKF